MTPACNTSSTPWTQHSAALVLFSSMVVVGVVLNVVVVIVIGVFVWQRLPRGSVAALCVASQSIADCLLCIVSLPIAIAHQSDFWAASDLSDAGLDCGAGQSGVPEIDAGGCRFFVFVTLFFISGSILSGVSLTLTRLRATLSPLRYATRSQTHFAVAVLGCTWLLATTMATIATVTFRCDLADSIVDGPLHAAANATDDGRDLISSTVASSSHASVESSSPDAATPLANRVVIFVVVLLAFFLPLVATVICDVALLLSLAAAKNRGSFRASHRSFPASKVAAGVAAARRIARNVAEDKNSSGGDSVVENGDVDDAVLVRNGAAQSRDASTSTSRRFDGWRRWIVCGAGRGAEHGAGTGAKLAPRRIFSMPKAKVDDANGDVVAFRLSPVKTKDEKDDDDNDEERQTTNTDVSDGTTTTLSTTTTSSTTTTTTTTTRLKLKFDAYNRKYGLEQKTNSLVEYKKLKKWTLEEATPDDSTTHPPFPLRSLSHDSRLLNDHALSRVRTSASQHSLRPRESGPPLFASQHSLSGGAISFEERSGSRRSLSPNEIGQRSSLPRSGQSSFDLHSEEHRSIKQRSAIRDANDQSSSRQHSATQPSINQHSANQHSATQPSINRHSTNQPSTTQHSTIQHSTNQPSTTKNSSDKTFSAPNSFDQNDSKTHIDFQNSHEADSLAVSPRRLQPSRDQQRQRKRMYQQQRSMELHPGLSSADPGRGPRMMTDSVCGGGFVNHAFASSSFALANDDDDDDDKATKTLETAMMSAASAAALAASPGPLEEAGSAAETGIANRSDLQLLTAPTFPPHQRLSSHALSSTVLLAASIGTSGGENHRVLEKSLPPMLKRLTTFSLSKELRAARTVLMVLVGLLLCWFPFFIGLLCRLEAPVPWRSSSASTCPFPRAALDALVWLGFAHPSIFNPLVTIVLNNDFREGFRRMWNRSPAKSCCGF